MLFDSFAFPVFLIVVFTLHWSLSSHKARNFLLLLASCVFYGWWDWRFLFLLFFSAMIDYYIGLKLEATDVSSRRKTLLAASMVLNLGLLGVFKYYNFFAENFMAFSSALGFRADLPTLKVILPVGISFYTFQSLSYVFDIYRKVIPARRSPVDFMVFVSFFPHLVAGPIQMAKYLLPQVERPRRFDPMVGPEAMRYILWGYVLKCVVADNLSHFVDAVYAAPALHTPVQLLLATYAFAFQIYGDFAGYTYIALGTALLFGVRLTQNFNSPYLAQDVRDFWTRWHMTLTAWFREYVYIWWLGGGHVSSWRRVFNVMATFALSGLWHGAQWTFFAWGLVNGVLYFLPRLFRSKSRLAAAANILVTFNLVCLCWVFFRARNISEALYILKSIFALASPAALLRGLAHGPNPGVWVMVMGMMMFEVVQRRRPHIVWLEWMSSRVRKCLYAALLLVFFLYGDFNRTPFIYFQF